MSTTRLADTRLLVRSIVLSGGIFAIDLSLPLDMAGGAGYVIIVLLHQYDGSLPDLAAAGTPIGRTPAQAVIVVLVYDS